MKTLLLGENGQLGWEIRRTRPEKIDLVFCDIDPRTYCIDPEEIERHITPNTTAILGVHFYSRPCDIKALQKIADKNGLKLLFDAAPCIRVQLF